MTMEERAAVALRATLRREYAMVITQLHHQDMVDARRDVGDVKKLETYHDPREYWLFKKRLIIALNEQLPRLIEELTGTAEPVPAGDT